MTHDWMTQFGWTLPTLREVVARACWRLQESDIDDIGQETFIAVGRKLSGPNPPDCWDRDAVARYVFTVALNKAKNLYKERARQLTTVDTRVFEAGREPEPRSEKRTRRLDLKNMSSEQRENILALLPEDLPKLREVMRLYFQGHTGVEIARALGVSEATVSRLKKDAQDMIEKEIARLLE